MKNILIKQHSLTADYVNDAGDSRRVDFLASQLRDLTDCLLSDAQLRLRSLKNAQAKNFDDECRQFELWRTKMITPLRETANFLIFCMIHRKIVIFSVILNQSDKAIELGETYKDFEILVRICEASNDSSLMDSYKLRFADQGFSQFLYNWHLNKGTKNFYCLFNQFRAKCL